MADAQLSGLAEELREKGIDCETVHKLVAGHEDSSVPISDPVILKYLSEAKGTITLITLDKELAEYCATFGIPYIRVQTLVADRILSADGRTQRT